MFGFAVANPEKLDEESRARYRAVYCGICRALGRRGAPLSPEDAAGAVYDGARRYRLVLSYDLVIVALLLSSVTDTPFEQGMCRCAVRPFRRHDYLYNRFTDYAADMNLLLAYYNFLDDIHDDGGFMPAAEAAMVWDGAAAVKNAYPALSELFERCLSGITAAENRDERDHEIPADLFGTLLGGVFAYFDLPEKETLRRFGFSLGKVIYYMDAAVDIKADLKKKRYNPLINKTAEQRQTILELQLADCMQIFSSLPVMQDKQILENILLSGIWTSYQSKLKRK